VITLERRTS